MVTHWENELLISLSQIGERKEAGALMQAFLPIPLRRSILAKGHLKIFKRIVGYASPLFTAFIYSVFLHYMPVCSSCRIGLCSSMLQKHKSGPSVADPVDQL